MRDEKKSGDKMDSGVFYRRQKLLVEQFCHMEVISVQYSHKTQQNFLRDREFTITMAAAVVPWPP
jgi:hypothetical protein